MFGTELDTAYFNNTVQNQPTETLQPMMKQQMHDQNKQEQAQQPEQHKYEPIMTQPPIFQQNDSMIKELQQELEKQRTLNAKKESEPLYDRFVSKKKDVMKLLNIALTVLFAISLHFVFSDLIKDYITNNDFTSNKETFIKCMYPACVLMVLWSLKVFNK
ncbi:hypothetical protein QKU58_gp081 [Pyramimonas orientalis virus]|uniref:Transmembrane protein n=1 Tax=Pyramimonas orientalis virus 01B TaxID=3134525 RepID=A0A7L9AYH7_9VIRU|nr:hypothetical protein QKU58_gp081 [Pyramimonas orientalis virus]QOI90250.1 hypothetical protein HWQ62_00113 [Pyramimonas orientalis virus]